MALVSSQPAVFDGIGPHSGSEQPDGAEQLDFCARIRAIFPSLDEEVVTSVLAYHRGALVPSLMQCIELSDDEEVAACMDELEALLEHARQDETLVASGTDADMDEQIALAASLDRDEQVALALQRSLDADAAAAAAASPPALAGWRKNVAKLVSKLSASEFRQLTAKSSRYRSRTGIARLIDPEEQGGASSSSEAHDQPSDGSYVPPPEVHAPSPPAASLYESRVQRARTSNERPRSARPGGDYSAGFTDLSLESTPA